MIEIVTPACLLLGLVQLDGRPCELGITLQHPPVHLLAREAAGLLVTGARADAAYRQATQFLGHFRLPPRAELEIELAIPSCMGLGSSPMLGLSVARALAALDHVRDVPTEELARAVGLADDEALEMHAFTRGGLLVVDDAGQVRQRWTIAHADEARDWVWVFVLPHTPAGTPETLEVDRRAALHTAAPYLSPATGQILTAELWPAVEQDDIERFAPALMALQAANHDALARASQPIMLTADEQAILGILRANGALAWGRTLTGLCLYGLIKGGGPSRALRSALMEQLGFFGGTVMATICDNDGTRKT